MTQQTPPAPPMDGPELASLFRYASRLMARAHHGRRHESHARQAQVRVLAILRETGPVSQGELLRRLDVRSASLSELLGKLERNGLVRRERNPEDRRSFIVSATAAADALLSEREQAGPGGDDRFFACLDDTEKEALRAILSKLVASLRDEDVGGSGRGPCGQGRGRRMKEGRKGRGGRFSGGRGGRR